MRARETHQRALRTGFVFSARPGRLPSRSIRTRWIDCDRLALLQARHQYDGNSLCPPPDPQPYLYLYLYVWNTYTYIYCVYVCVCVCVYYMYVIYIHIDI